MIELICSRQSEKDGHAMDVLMEALRKQRVQAHIAGELQRALARAKEQKKGEHAILCLGHMSTGYPLQEWQVRLMLVVPWFRRLSIPPRLPLHVSFPVLCVMYSTGIVLTFTRRLVRYPYQIPALPKKGNGLLSDIHRYVCPCIMECHS